MVNRPLAKLRVPAKTLERIAPPSKGPAELCCGPAAPKLLAAARNVRSVLIGALRKLKRSSRRGTPSGNAIAALKATLAIKARVKRDGKWVDPAARELVPGDAIRLRLGDIVPADARLLDGDEISVDQSALTGESLPATRKSGDAVFSGSIVRRGEIGALVYATGGKTYFGKTAELVETAVTVSHFQKAVLKIGNYLIMLAVAMVAVIIGLGVYRGNPIVTTLQFARHRHVNWAGRRPSIERADDDKIRSPLSPPSLSTGGDQHGGLAVFSVSAQPAHGRGDAGGARYRREPRNGEALG